MCHPGAPSAASWGGIHRRADTWQEQGDNEELQDRLAALIEVTDSQHRAAVTDALGLVDYALETGTGIAVLFPEP